MRETELYAPVKAFLEAQDYSVKSEIADCDLVAQRGDEPLVIVELKRNLSLALLLQGVDRLAVSDIVYIAAPAGKGRRWYNQIKDMQKLCRRLGLGLITVHLKKSPVLVQVHVDPGPYQPRKAKKRQQILLKEFTRRIGDPNTGGQTRRKMVTAYRQDALQIATYLAAKGQASPAELSRILNLSNAASILQKNHYGWFMRASRGVYILSALGQTALEEYSHVVSEMQAHDESNGCTNNR